jgi:hypothetical protein
MLGLLDGVTVVANYSVIVIFIVNYNCKGVRAMDRGLQQQ